MAVTARQLNRATLARQLLLERERVSVVEAVRRVVALQAQNAASTYIALWNRIADFDATELDKAFADHSVVKATLMRITLHAVVAQDYPAFQHAMVSSLRAARLNDRRFKDTGMSIDEADALVEDLLAFASEPRTNADVEAWVESHTGEAWPRAWWALRTYAPVVHAATGGAWSHGQRPSYVASKHPPATGAPDASVQHLVRRYLEGFGPATTYDIAQFTILRQPVVREALSRMDDSLVTVDGPSGAVFYDVPNGEVPDEDTPAPPRLMAMWDSSLLAYADRDRIIPSAYRSHVIRKNGDVLPMLLVDGHVAGVWRPVDGGIEAAAFHELRRQDWRELAVEARALVAFLADREPDVYRRFIHWWKTIPTAEVRVLQ